MVQKTEQLQEVDWELIDQFKQSLQELKDGKARKL